MKGLLLFIAFACATPALEVGVSEAGLTFVAQVLGKRVIPRLGTLQIPALPSQRFSCAGHCYLTVKGGSLGGLACPTPRLGISPPSTLSASVAGCSLKGKVDWKLNNAIALYAAVIKAVHLADTLWRHRHARTQR